METFMTVLDWLVYWYSSLGQHIAALLFESSLLAAFLALRALQHGNRQASGTPDPISEIAQTV